MQGIPFTPNARVRKRMRDASAKLVRMAHANRIRETQRVKKEAIEQIGVLTSRELFMLGIGLYIGEGSKSHENVEITNGDPEVICLAMKWFREVFNLKNEHFKITIHAYPDTSIPGVLKFWSEVTNVPVSRFGKIQIDSREKVPKKHRKLPHGTIRITIRSCGIQKFGVELHRRIMGWIEAIFSQSDSKRV